MQIKKQIIDILKKKAKDTPCKFKVSAIGFNTKGEIVIKTSNRPRFSRFGGGIHAETKIFKLAKRKNIKTILICRVGKTGNILPIDPCNRCKTIADKLGIKIISVKEN